MTYQVLARKLRPSNFAELVGQDHVVRALSHGLDNDRLHHAYLFTGTRGVGKTTIGRIFAKSLNCESGVSSKPCGQCSICQEVSENRFVDLIEVDAASRTRVDDTRELLENAQYLPTRGRYKVYLIDEVHMLSTSSFNALLKTLEEPPEHVKFLLATTDPKKLPITVLSRCLQFQLRNLSAGAIFEYLLDVLKVEQVEHEQGAIELISRAAQGSMRDALSITDQAISHGGGRLLEAELVEMLGLVGRSEIDVLLREIFNGDLKKLLSIIEELDSQGADFVSVLSDLVSAFHDLSVDLALGREKWSQYTDHISAELLQLLYQISLMGYRDIRYVPDPRSGLEMTVLRMIAFMPSNLESDVPAITQPYNEKRESDKEEPRYSVDSSVLDSSLENTDKIEIDWEELVVEMSLSGVSLMIAENCILEDYLDGHMLLKLDQRHDTLLNDGQRALIEKAVSDCLDEEVSLKIVVGKITGETLALARANEERKRQSDAETSVRADPAFQSLLDTFDGVLEEIEPSAEKKSE